MCLFVWVVGWHPLLWWTLLTPKLWNKLITVQVQNPLPTLGSFSKFHQSSHSIALTLAVIAISMLIAMTARVSISSGTSSNSKSVKPAWDGPNHPHVASFTFISRKHRSTNTWRWPRWFLLEDSKGKDSCHSMYLYLHTLKPKCYCEGGLKVSVSGLVSAHHC